VELDPRLDHPSIGPRRGVDVQHVVFVNHVANARQPTLDAFWQSTAGDLGKLVDTHPAELRRKRPTARAHRALEQ
jgi:hypothetical protein